MVFGGSFQEITDGFGRRPTTRIVSLAVAFFPMRISLFVMAVLASAVLGCTPAQVQVVNGGIAIAGQACQGYAVFSGDPAVAPLCATAEEIAQAVAELAEQAKIAVPAAIAAPASPAAIYKQIVADRAKKASPK